MLEIKAKVAEDGRIVVPAGYSQALGLNVGDEVTLRLEGGEVHISVSDIEKAIQHAQELVRRYIPPGRSLADELIAERRMESLRE